jgi:asparagine synthase (glutamine-hydrolysing)
MKDSLKHRGPDGEGQYIDGPVALGHRRLSIIDLSDKGSQPMCNEDETIWITYNGEIFNYIELREELIKKGHDFKSKTDTEVIIHAYEEYGTECLKKLNGMFAFVLYDKKEDVLFCARDRYGIKPFYYYIDNEKFVFASEIKAILQDTTIHREQNDRTIYDYLVFNRYDHCEETFFKDIYRLPPSHFLIIKDNKMEIKKWWNTTIQYSKRDRSSNINHFRSLFKDSVRLRLRSDVPVGSCLSGGLDSSSIVCTINDLIGNKGNFQTFSAVYDREWVKDESEYIEEVVEKTNTKKNYIYPDENALLNDLHKFIYYQEEPFGHTSFFVQWMVMKLAHRNNTKVLLDGQGGDELLAGYMYMFGYYFYELFKEKRYFKLLKEISLYYKNHKTIFGILLFFFMMAPESLQKRIAFRVNVGSDITLRKWVSKDFYNVHKEKSSLLADFINAKSLNKALQKHIVYKLEHLLRCEDKSAMAFSIETRLPFLDYRLVDFMFTVPSYLKIDNGTTKVILREAMKDTIPEKIVNRQSKFGFETKEADWFRTDAFKVLILDIINSQSFRNRPYYDIEEVEKEVQKFFNGKKNISRTIWRWLNLELWFRMFIDGEIGKLKPEEMRKNGSKSPE